MNEINSVSVLIYGQEYNLAGDMSRDYILKLANRVDEKMREVSNGKNQTISKTAVLAAMLIADEYYQAAQEAADMAENNDRLEKQAKNYEALWEDAKNSFTAYKAEQEKTIDILRAKIQEQELMLADTQDVPSEAQQRIEELESRCRDIESSFFDLQMENIRLKNELDKVKDF